MPALPEQLTPLSILSGARLGAAEYYSPLLESSDPILRIGAWCMLLDRGELSDAQYPEVIALASEFPSIRDRAYRYFLRFFEYDQATQIVNLPGSKTDEALRRAMACELSGDSAGHAAALRDLFLATGRLETLAELAGVEDRIAGWRGALPVAVHMIVLNPHDPALALDLFHYVHESRQVELLDALVALLETNSLHPAATLLYSAASKLMKGNAGGCLKTLGALSEARIARPDIAARLRSVAFLLTAEALEKMGDYRKAYAAYRDMKAISLGKPSGLEEFTDMVTQSAAIEIPTLPTDTRTNHFVMTGFPRSGTTLLENALAVHPRIETFEEIPSGSSAHLYLDRVLPTLAPDDERAAIFLEARERYYREVERRHRKATADVLIDKMPIRSAEARFMVRLFPDKRYIFSIRHPYDVVLSCFKQRFSPNIAMDHFRTFETAARLYDFTMEQWFSVFSLDAPNVKYVRYDQLVTEFEPTVAAILEFLGVGWDDAVKGFAQAATERSARTPSYHKVRQGLGIGVQTAWRNYRFLYESDAARPLKKWVEFFGYHAE